jgi:hypothetical protein
MVMAKLRKVILNDAEQVALRWLLNATDNGEIVAGSDQKAVTQLGKLRKRLGRNSAEYLMRKVRP